MKYYFTGSTRHLDKDSQTYKTIIDQLNRLGCKGLNYVHFPKNDPLRLKYEEQLVKEEIAVYELQTSLIDQSDILIADIDRESITVGYQINYAIRKKIPILVLVNKDHLFPLPVMLTSNHFGLLTVERYGSEKDICRILNNYIKSVIPSQIKFNFFINIPIHNYISKRAAKENMSKSEVIREIILQEMKQKPF